MNRKLLKDNAKIALKHNFWLVMLVVFVAQFFGVTDMNSGSGYSGGSSGGSYESSGELDEFFEDLEDKLNEKFGDDYGYSINNENGNMQLMSFETGDFKGFELPGAVAALSYGIILFIIVVAIAFGVAWSAFIVNPIQVGYRRFFMMNRQAKGKFADLFSAFCPKYWNIVKGMFTTNFFIFAWSLLFLIPGIIKAYEYYFVPFLLCENPEMTGARAREISKAMTDGHKFQIFVLELSFIGWSILAALLAIPAVLLTCCLMGIGGTMVVTPLAAYMAATYAELYEERREYVLYNHIVSNEELCGFEQ